MFALDFNRNAAGSAAQTGGTAKAKKGEVALANRMAGAVGKNMELKGAT